MKQQSKYIIIVTFTILILGIAGALFWYFTYDANAPEAPPAQSDTTEQSTESNPQAPPKSPEQKTEKEPSPVTDINPAQQLQALDKRIEVTYDRYGDSIEAEKRKALLAKMADHENIKELTTRATRGDIYAQLELGIFYDFIAYLLKEIEKSKEAKQVKEESNRYIQQAKNKGVLPAEHFFLFQQFSPKTEKKPDRDTEGKDKTKQVKKRSNPSQQVENQHAHLFQVCPPKSGKQPYVDTQGKEKTEEWLMKKEEAGSILAKYLLGLLYYHEGQNPSKEQDLKKAKERLSQAAEKGYAPAQCFLGIYHEEEACKIFQSKNGEENKKEVKFHLKKAEGYLNQAREQDDPLALYLLGRFYEKKMRYVPSIRKPYNKTSMALSMKYFQQAIAGPLSFLAEEELHKLEKLQKDLPYIYGDLPVV